MEHTEVPMSHTALFVSFALALFACSPARQVEKKPTPAKPAATAPTVPSGPAPIAKYQGEFDGWYVPEQGAPVNAVKLIILDNVVLFRSLVDGPEEPAFIPPHDFRVIPE